MDRSPEGRYLAGSSWIHFCASSGFWGVVLWGRPGSDDTEQLVRSLARELQAPAVPHVSLVDASRIESVDAAAFASLDRYVRSEQQRLSVAVRRLALVRASGMAGAVVAGFFQVLPKPYPVDVFADVAGALAWLDHGAGGEPLPSSHAAELSEAVATAAAAPPVVVALRALLEDRSETLAVHDAARALAVSERTLQRRLSEVGTSFSEELTQARLRRAERLMLDTDLPLTTIALEVGCASLQHFSALFRKRNGESPSAWRERRRS
jgi:AraC-like DNA-binding protein